MSSDDEQEAGGEEWGALADELDLGDDDDSSTDGGDDDNGAGCPASQPQPQQAPVAGVVRRSALSHAEFEGEFRHRQPVLLEQLAKDWTALSRWSSVDHLATLLPSPDVLVLRSPDGRRFLKRDCEQQHRPFADVARELFGQHQPAAPVAAGGGGARMYARSPLAAGLRAEVDLAGLEQLVGGDVFKDENSGVWLGTAGNVTPLHYDLCHGFLIQIIGTKTITYFEPDDYRCLYQRKENPELSQVDLDAWRRADAAEADAGTAPGPAATSSMSTARCGGGDGGGEEDVRSKWPLFGDATPRFVTLEPGDCLYTPPFWWHHVATSGTSAALSVLVPFDMQPDEKVHHAHFM